MDNLRKIELVLVILCVLICALLIINNPKGITGFLINSQENLNAPHDFFTQENIEVYPDRIIINIDNYTLSKYSLSESMLPVFDSNANGVGIKPNSEQDIHMGDIITFRQYENLIVHRVVDIGEDEQGWFCITRGDRNDFSDGKVRFEKIDSVLVALIY